MKIFIDNGHGLMTAGKRSPDGQFREPFYNREIARRVMSDLKDRGLDAELLVPEDDDISLAERYLGQHPRQRRRKRLKMAECDRMEYLYLQGADRVRQARRMPLPGSNQELPWTPYQNRYVRWRYGLGRRFLYLEKVAFRGSADRELL